MQVNHTQNGSVTVVSVAGSLDAMTSPQLTEILSQQLAAGNAQLVADFAALEYASSAGLRVLLSTTKQARQRGGDVRLAGAQGNVRKVFELSGFTSILKSYPDVQSAVASFQNS
jgi:anti-sigma B factor antagonist